jgi:uncharacterized protein YndB with AHSA1/START domain
MKRKHEFEVRIAATPEQVWKAVSDAGEITKWFAPEARVKPGAGGSVWLSWGPGMEGEAPISIWEPGRRLQTLEGPGENPKTVDYFIEAGDGWTILRLVHSGFGAEASFDNEYESTYGGWLAFLAMLQFGLEHHPAEPHVNVTIMRMLHAPADEAWTRLAAGLGLDPDQAEGEGYTAKLGGESLTGRVLRRPKPGYACLSVDGWNDALLSLFVEKYADQCALTVTCVLFGEAVERAADVRARV